MTVPRLSACRVCGWPALTTVLDLGTLAFCGVFPLAVDLETVPTGPLELVTCDACGLAQLAHEYPPADLYGDHYGYRSGLNAGMVAHLREIATEAWEYAAPAADAVVVDIGANDGTLLHCYPATARRWAFDPLIAKYADYYAPGIVRVPAFATPGMPLTNVSIVTTIACFYDMPDPVGVAQSIADMLRPGGIWSVEVADLDAMIEHLAFDQIVHEHLEYYRVADLLAIGHRVGLSCLKITHDATNGGSFRCLFRKGDEASGRLHGAPPAPPIDWLAFKARIDAAVAALRGFLDRAKAAGETVWGYGASTKGNVLLQLASVTPADVSGIIDVNADKDGHVTPGTGIDIWYWRGALITAANPLPEYFLVLPWHFRAGILAREADYLTQGGRFVFPLPRLEVVGPLPAARADADTWIL
jgi:hypothetical protein